jgi:phospholipid transport system substrate-binding protein
MQTLPARLCLLLVLAGCFPAVPAGNADPVQLMRDATNDILSRLDASPQLTKNRAGLMQLIEQEIFPLVDFRRAARLTLGHYWKDAGDTQRKRFISELRRLLACTYSTAFSNYAGQKVEWLQPRWSTDRDYVEIRVRILQNGESPVPVAYRLLKTNGQWKLYDLVVEGVSLVANYRSTFSQRLQEHDLDALIDELAAHNAQRCGSGDQPRG